MSNRNSSSRKIKTLLEFFGFVGSKSIKDVLLYENGEIKICLSKNPRDSLNSLWVQANSEDLIEIDDKFIFDFFKSDLKLSSLSDEEFMENVYIFFNTIGKEILLSNKRIFTEMYFYDEQRSIEYTRRVVEYPLLKEAEKAWKEGRYLDVINTVDKISKESLSTSMLQKYKLAKKRILK